MLVAGTHSGVGKTTIATGIMAAFAQHGKRVRAAKVGPDYIDPGYHRLATGSPSRNLDSFLSPARLVPALTRRAAEGGDILVVEGVMGLFDGAGRITGLEEEEEREEREEAERVKAARMTTDPASVVPARASSAEIAVLTATPVVLVVDAGRMSQSVAALVHGYVSFGPPGLVKGLILNRVGSADHEEGLRRALEPLGLPVLGALRRDSAFSWRDRHLGLVPVAEHPADIRRSLRYLASAVAAAVDLDCLEQLARAAPALLPSAELTAASPLATAGGRRRPRIAVAGGPAFSFLYPETTERFEEAGAELVALDPVEDPVLPERVDGVYAGGGFPEVYAEQLALNRPLLADVARFASRGGPVWAECGGLLWMSAVLDGHPQCGVVPATGTMTGRLTIGYRLASVLADNPVAAVGTVLRGHELHYSTLDPPGQALRLANGTDTWCEGHATPSVLATYLHQHLAADPAPAERFVSAAARFGTGREEP